MNEIITKVEYYIKGEESNLEKQSKDTSKKSMTREEGSGRKHDSSRTSLRDRPREHATQRPNRRPFDPNNFETPLNIRRGNFLQEVMHLNLISEAPHPKRDNSMTGRDVGAWCSYHKLWGHHTGDFL